MKWSDVITKQKIEVTSTSFFTKCNKRKSGDRTRKKTEHTRIVAQLCSSMMSIFTLVVVYSRTKNKIKPKNQTRVIVKLFDFGFIQRCIASGNKKKKKNGAHTHVCTTVQLGEHNIHVSCCLFSHIPEYTKPTKPIVLWK